MASRGEGGEQLPKAADHLGGSSAAVGRADQQVDRTKPVLLEAERFSNASFDVVSLGRGRGVLSCHQHSQPRRACGTPLEVQGVAGKVAPRPVAKQMLELRAPAQPASGVEPEALARAYSPRRRRPLERRLRSTARPPRVRLRTRKPWRLARRVFDG
jgi:hypothetical protein